MNNIQTEREILYTAIEGFQKTTGLKVEIETEPIIDEFRGDAVIHVVFQDTKLHFVVEVKKWLTRTALGIVTQQLNIKKYPYKGLLVARYVTPQIGEILKEMNTPFIDMAGNAYINEPPLFIFIKGKKLLDIQQTKPQIRAFAPTGLKIIFALLCRPNLIDATFREIAAIANVALGTVAWVIRDLRQEGYIVNLGKHRRHLLQKKKLLERWVLAYPEKLRPKLQLGTYEAKKNDWWKQTKLTGVDTFWGGEIAGAKLTQYLKPQVTTIYTNQPIIELLQKYRLRKDPRGEIEILKTFWHLTPNWQHYDLVHPIIIYADLLATGDPRNIETANIIYEKELVGLIKED